MARIPGEDMEGYTLPERRKACRETDIPVSTKEYKRLRDLEESIGDYVEDVTLDQIRGKVGEDCKAGGVTVEMGKGTKAAKASSLREHDITIGYRNRIDLISEKIVGAIIVGFREQHTLQDFLHDGAPSEDNPLVVDGIKVPPMGWVDDEEELVISSSDEDSRTTKGDSRGDFLYHLRRSVETRVNNKMMELLKVEFNNRSIWDDLRVVVDLRKRECDSPRHVNADVFFAEIKKEGE